MFVYILAFFLYFLYVESASFVDMKLFVCYVAMAYLVPYTQETLEKQWTTKQNA